VPWRDFDRFRGYLGCDATRKIREEVVCGGNLSIIALTANAMPEEWV
jgi:hypothetical protein